MDFDDNEAPKKGTLLSELLSEKLDAWSIDELEQRIVQLTQEIERARAALVAKKASQKAADLVFRS